MKQWLNKALNSGYPITQEVCLTQKGATWVNNACQIIAGSGSDKLVFRFSVSRSSWVSNTSATQTKCDKIPNAQFDPSVIECIITMAPTATEVYIDGTTTGTVASNTGIITKSGSVNLTKEECAKIGGTTYDNVRCAIK